MKLHEYTTLILGNHNDENGENCSPKNMLMGVRASGLKNDALLDVFYDIIAQRYRPGHEYGVFLFHDRYDIPAKAADHERLGESERVFEYLICAVCPVSGDYDAGETECGFLFPAYAEGGALTNCIDLYQEDRIGCLF